ncbi:MAG TPA: universal stress protein [Bryobacteraceae bacterium]|nr:universal stress protein [Bryobacteraceae bacterium]
MASNPDSRPDPDRLLRQIEFDEQRRRLGRLKVFLGYASGVGKSFRMLDEGRRRKERGEDVIIGAVQSKLSPDLISLLDRFEIISQICADRGGAMDVPAIIARRPQVCLIDELAHRNPSGCGNAHRWQDVEQLLEAGIAIITAVNLNHIEELHDTTQQITGKEVRETVPKAFLMHAEEIAIVDAPPEQILERVGVRSETDRLVTERRLSELREMALLLAAEVVDRQLESYLEAHGIGHSIGAHEKILVCITPRANARLMIESGRRNAQRFHGELIVAYVQQSSLSAADQELLESHLALARDASARVEVLEDGDPIEAILRFANQNGVTQIFIGHSLRQDWWTRLFGGPVDRLIRQAEGIDVRIFPH